MLLASSRHVDVDLLEPGSIVEMAYCSESGSVTRRRVRIISSYDARNGNSYLRAWCFLRGEERTFRADRILECRGTEPPYPAIRVETGAPAVRRPAQKSRAGSGFGSVAAAGIAVAIFKFLLNGGAAAQAPPLPVYTIPKSLSAASVTASAPRAAAEKKPVEADPRPIRAVAFEKATGLQSPRLERLYVSADANRSDSLSWAELATFQRTIRSRYRYLSNETALSPDQFLAQGGGDCEDWAELTCGLLRYWGWEPYVGSFRSPAGDEAHAVCLVRVAEAERGFTYCDIPEGAVLTTGSAPAGRFVPVDYEVVGGFSSAMGSSWNLHALYVPERIYGSPM
jgi:hypothetical protein